MMGRLIRRIRIPLVLLIENPILIQMLKVLLTFCHLHEPPLPLFFALSAEMAFALDNFEIESVTGTKWLNCVIFSVSVFISCRLL